MPYAQQIQSNRHLNPKWRSGYDIDVSIMAMVQNKLPIFIQVALYYQLCAIFPIIYAASIFDAIFLNHTKYIYITSCFEVLLMTNEFATNNNC